MGDLFSHRVGMEGLILVAGNCFARGLCGLRTKKMTEVMCRVVLLRVIGYEIGVPCTYEFDNRVFVLRVNTIKTGQDIRARVRGLLRSTKVSI